MLLKMGVLDKVSAAHELGEIGEAMEKLARRLDETYVALTTDIQARVAALTDLEAFTASMGRQLVELADDIQAEVDREP
jgi:predicted metal-dependent hydrolase